MIGAANCIASLLYPEDDVSPLVRTQTRLVSLVTATDGDRKKLSVQFYIEQNGNLNIWNICSIPALIIKFNPMWYVREYN